jgi:uncharacterized protein YjbJ (UPF0337 family)
MNKDRAAGTIDKVVGTAKRKAGEWTGDTPLQAKGIAQQLKGGFENALGKAKDAIDEANKKVDIHAEISLSIQQQMSKAPRAIASDVPLF